ncbi:trypsin-like peptidase domain-containing protein [Arthrobacter mobilis]|uniref:Zinc-ribbon domain-containing protein n=1 Tax=Arthrobacter mobilis TaxID=2724944 RepID=A0A7X6K731_9MICC|nr:trypsin-like peptidase domain-containing protein [Arthrobacter mobilis]NKX56349.1 zinc-ribbon domain-containing protein [Arthrobacter mobilis]
MRIELRAVAEIAHIDHTSGEVEIDRGRSTVPLGSATGVLVSADGIVATTWENLAVDKDAVAVYAANELFAKVIRVPVRNGGNPARRGSTPDRYWAPHLNHCYDQVTHCVHFRVPQYHVRTYTSEPGGVMAELLNTPSKPHDVALLRISGGGATPTASLSATDTAPGADSVLLGFTKRPTPEVGPVEIPVKVDAAAGRISSPKNLAAPLDAGVSGGPVLDRATGQVLGLAGPRQREGQATLVPSAAIQAAMAEAGVAATPSKFDAVFRRGVDHLASGNRGGSAESALEESLTYYDSALAASHLEEARTMRDGQSDGGPADEAETDTGGSLPPALLPILIGLLLLAGVIGAIALRRRNRSVTAQAGGGATTTGASRPSPARASTAPANRSKADELSTRAASTTTAAWVDREQAGRGRTGSSRTEASEYQSPAPQRPPAPGRPAAEPAPPVPDTNLNPNPGPAAEDDTRTAVPLAPHDSNRQAVAFCSQCGRQVLPGARFCVGCGHRVG